MSALFIIGIIIFLIGVIAWGITIFQIYHNHRTDLLPLTWVFLAIMWVGIIIVRISNIMIKLR